VTWATHDGIMRSSSHASDLLRGTGTEISSGCADVAQQQHPQCVPVDNSHTSSCGHGKSESAQRCLSCRGVPPSITQHGGVADRFPELCFLVEV
jgi:hypothetical protein